jgi:hypothetical protein
MLQQCKIPFPIVNMRLVLANIHASGLQILPRLSYLPLQLLVRIRNIVEGEDAPAELEQEVCAEGDEGPEWNLLRRQGGNGYEGRDKRTTGTTSF